MAGVTPVSLHCFVSKPVGSLYNWTKPGHNKSSSKLSLNQVEKERRSEALMNKSNSGLGVDQVWTKSARFSHRSNNIPVQLNIVKAMQYALYNVTYLSS